MKIKKKKKTKPILKRARKPAEAAAQTRFQKIYRPIVRRWKMIVAVAGAVVIVGAAVGGYFWYRHDREVRASRAYASAQSRLADMVREAASRVEEGGTVDEEAVVAETEKELANIVERYGDTAAGRAAAYELASLHFDRGRYDDAQKLFEEVERKTSGLQRILAAKGVADCHRARGELEPAIAKYREIFDGHPEEFPAVPVAMALAECYRRTDRSAEAVELYRFVLDYHRLSPYAPEAEEELRKAEAVLAARD
ncbi:MAG: tetratricopeptide repeat protein [Candidatus Coatesbacteria bacterium]|nr:MAG: tetratricopeptide repeat protein [Candidatus Coatesbacteria bacterium]